MAIAYFLFGQLFSNPITLRGQTMRYTTIAIALALTSLNAWAGAAMPDATIPEPGVLPLIAIGAVGGLAIWARKRKKK